MVVRIGNRAGALSTGENVMTLRRRLITLVAAIALLVTFQGFASTPPAHANAPRCEEIWIVVNGCYVYCYPVDTGGSGCARTCVFAGC
jgi:hypothetical protein